MRICPECLSESDAALCADDGIHTLALGPGDAWLGELLAERYLLLELIGRGGMGVVYRAWDRTTKRDVAVKLWPEARPDRPDRFEREARITAGLSSPHIVRVFDFGQSAQGARYIVMELIEGRPLRALLDEEGAIAPIRAVELIKQVCDALTEAHAKGLVHRDLKPANIMVQVVGEGREFARVLDFGVVRPSDPAEQLTAEGLAPGTPAYMSPEQARGRAVDGRSDVYSVGILLFEMLSGRRPFEGASAADLIVRHVTDAPPHLEGHPGLDAIVHRCLAKDPADRFADVGALRNALQSTQSGEAVAETLDSYPAVAAPAPAQVEAKTRLKLSFKGLGCGFQLSLVFGALALAVLLPRAFGPGPVDEVAYSLEGPLGGLQSLRSTAAPSDRFGARSRVRFLLRPARALTQRAPVLQVFVSADGGPLRELRGFVTQHPKGVFLVEFTAGEVFEAAGSYEVHLVRSEEGLDLDGAPSAPHADALGWARRSLRYELPK